MCWFLILILSFVYWCLIKIVREFSWNVGNKEIGLSRILYTYPFIQIHVVCIFVWLWVFSFILNFVFNLFLFFIKRYNINKGNVLWKSWARFFIGIELIVGVKNPNWIFTKLLNFTYIQKLIIDRYTMLLLYGYSCNAAYFYDLPFYFREIQKFKHSFFLELIWAGFPTIIILLILAPSLYLLYSIDEELDPCITVKVIGHQWFWTYELNNWFFAKFQQNLYAKFWKIEQDSVLINEEFLIKGSKRLLEVNNPLVVPINVPIRFLITSSDVLHSWSVPELGLKIDAVPGRLNQFISVICRPGRLYGQCSELCGVSHGFMPIVVDSVTFNTFFQHVQNVSGIYKDGDFIKQVIDLQLKRNTDILNKYKNISEDPVFKKIADAEADAIKTKLDIVIKKWHILVMRSSHTKNFLQTSLYKEMRKEAHLDKMVLNELRRICPNMGEDIQQDKKLYHLSGPSYRRDFWYKYFFHALGLDDKFKELEEANEEGEEE